GVGLLGARVMGQPVIHPSGRCPDQAAVGRRDRVSVEHLDEEPGSWTFLGDGLPLHFVAVQQRPVVLRIVKTAVPRCESVVACLPVDEEVGAVRRADLRYDHADRRPPVRALAVLLSVDLDGTVQHVPLGDGMVVAHRTAPPLLQADPGRCCPDLFVIGQVPLPGAALRGRELSVVWHQVRLLDHLDVWPHPVPPVVRLKKGRPGFSWPCPCATLGSECPDVKAILNTSSDISPSTIHPTRRRVASATDSRTRMRNLSGRRGAWRRSSGRAWLTGRSSPCWRWASTSSSRPHAS